VVTSLYLKIDVVKDGDFQNWTSFVLELGLGAYMATAILTYENFQKNKNDQLRTKRNQFVMKMIGKNLIGQTSLLASLQSRKGQNNIATNMLTGEKIDMESFNEKGLQLNNMELKSLLNVSFDVIDTDLLDKLIEISGKFDFIDKFKQESTERGEWLILTLIKQTIEKYFPELMTDFQNTGASTTETHNFDQSDKS
jgi:hypothetical protein